MRIWRFFSYRHDAKVKWRFFFFPVINCPWKNGILWRIYLHLWVAVSPVGSQFWWRGGRRCRIPWLPVLCDLVGFLVSDLGKTDNNASAVALLAACTQNLHQSVNDNVSSKASHESQMKSGIFWFSCHQQSIQIRPWSESVLNSTGEKRGSQPTFHGFQGLQVTHLSCL